MRQRRDPCLLAQHSDLVPRVLQLPPGGRTLLMRRRQRSVALLTQRRQRGLALLAQRCQRSVALLALCRHGGLALLARGRQRSLGVRRAPPLVRQLGLGRLQGAAQAFTRVGRSHNEGIQGRVLTGRSRTGAGCAGRPDPARNAKSHWRARAMQQRGAHL